MLLLNRISSQAYIQYKLQSPHSIYLEVYFLQVSLVQRQHNFPYLSELQGKKKKYVIPGNSYHIVKSNYFLADGDTASVQSGAALSLCHPFSERSLTNMEIYF